MTSSSTIIPPLLIVGVMCLLANCAGPGSTRSGEVASDTIDRARAEGLSPVAAIPGIRIDPRYATTRNGAGKAIYPAQFPCLLHQHTAAKLARAQATLQNQGYGLKIYDAWRPVEAQQALWDATRNPSYVLPPSVLMSLHCSGIAVDCTLVDAAGREMRMPTGFDVFSARASSQYQGDDPEIRLNLERLQSAMKGAGFSTIPNEWWHFEDLSVQPRPVKASALGIVLRRR